MLNRLINRIVFGTGFAIAFVLVGAVALNYALPRLVTSAITETKQPEFKNPREAEIAKPDSKLSNVVAGGAVDSLLATDPHVAAERAFAAGDQRHIVVPMCGNPRGEVLPGWVSGGPRQHFEAVKAIENGRRPVTCKDLGEASDSQEVRRVTEYAERYNRRLLELTKRAGQ